MTGPEFSDYLDKRGLSNYQAARAIGVSEPLIRKWRKKGPSHLGMMALGNQTVRRRIKMEMDRNGNRKGDDKKTTNNKFT